MSFQSKHHVEKVWSGVSPNQIVGNKINKSNPHDQGEIKIIEQNKSSNHSPTQDSGLQNVFFRPNTSDPQQSPARHYQGLVPAIETFGPLGLGWR